MASGRRGAEAVAVFATVLALAACGTQIGDDPTVSLGPTSPTDEVDRTGSGDVQAPTSTAPTTTASTTAPGETATGTTDPTASGVPTPGATADTPSAAVTETRTVTGTPTGTPPGTPTGTAGETGATEEPDSLPDFAAPGDVLRADPGGAAQLIIDEVRLGVQDGYDRVVLDLSGTGRAGWIVQYVPDPALDGSGIPVDLTGDFVLQVTTQGMAYPEEGDPAYDTALLLVADGELHTVTEVLRSTPFEGAVPVFIGTTREAPFRVFRLGEPERLVIDIQH